MVINVFNIAIKLLFRTANALAIPARGDYGLPSKLLHLLFYGALYFIGS